MIERRTAWTLTLVALAALALLTGAPAIGSHGLFTPERTGGKFAAPHFAILARHERDWYYVGAVRPRREGRTYPRDEVLACVAGLPFVAQASIVPAPTSAADRPWAFVLLVFVGAVPHAEIERRRDRWTRVLEDAIARGMGEEFLPDRIEFFPLYARRTREGEVDHAWCQGQFLTGALHRKARAEADRALAELRALAVFGRPPALAAEEAGGEAAGAAAEG